MDVVAVGHEGVAAVADAVEVDAHDVEARHDERCEGEHERVGQMRVGERHEEGELEAQEADDEADGEAAGVAHEDFFLTVGVAENVVVEERHQHACGGEGNHRVELVADEKEPHAVKDESHAGQTRGESVDAVDEVYCVDYRHDNQHRERIGEPHGDVVDAAETVEVAEVETADDEHQGADDLDDEFGAVADADEVVGDAGDVDERQGAEAEGEGDDVVGHSVEDVGQPDDHVAADEQGESEVDDRRKSQTAQSRHRAVVYLAFVDFIEEVLAESDEQNLGNDQTGDQRRNNKRQNDIRQPDIHKQVCVILLFT